MIQLIIDFNTQLTLKIKVFLWRREKGFKHLKLFFFLIMVRRHPILFGCKGQTDCTNRLLLINIKRGKGKPTGVLRQKWRVIEAQLLQLLFFSWRVITKKWRDELWTG